MQIGSIRTTCGCTVGKLSQTIYQPGESGHLVATMNIGARTGLQVQRIRVQIVEPVSKVVTLTMRVQVPETLAVEPGYLFWRPNETDSRVIEFKAPAGQMVRITEITSSDERFTMELEQVEKGRHYRLHVSPPDHGEPGVARIELHAITDGEARFFRRITSRAMGKR